MDDGEGAMHTTTHTHTNTQQYNKRIYFSAACTDAQTNMGGLVVMCSQHSYFIKLGHVEHGASE